MKRAHIDSGSSEDVAKRSHPSSSKNSASTHQEELNFLIVKSLLSPEDIDNLETYCRGKGVDCTLQATHFKKSGDASASEPRRSQIGWLGAPKSVALDDDSGCEEVTCPVWLFEKLNAAVQKGALAWPSVLPPSGRASTNVSSGCAPPAAGVPSALYEPIQYSQYGPGGHLSHTRLTRKTWRATSAARELITVRAALHVFFPAGGHYQQWHLDGKPPELGDGEAEDGRALSVVILLRAAEAGGHFETYEGAGMAALKCKAAARVDLNPGDAVIFPAQVRGFRRLLLGAGRSREMVPVTRCPLLRTQSALRAQGLWHRVTAVEAGSRSSLVAWAHRSDGDVSARQARVGLDGDDDDADDDDDTTVFIGKGASEDEDDDEEWQALERKFLSGNGDDLRNDFSGDDEDEGSPDDK